MSAQHGNPSAHTRIAKHRTTICRIIMDAGTGDDELDEMLEQQRLFMVIDNFADSARPVS